MIENIFTKTFVPQSHCDVIFDSIEYDANNTSNKDLERLNQK